MKQFLNNNKEYPKRRYNIVIISLVVLVAILAGGNVWTIFYYIPQISGAGLIENKFNLLNPTRNFFKQKDLIINFQPLRDYLNDKYEANKNISIYFEYLPTGASISINKDAEFWPASLLKLPVSMAVTKKIEKNEWKWTNELVIMTSDKNDGFGDLYKQPIGTKLAIEKLVQLSLSESDNTANFVLVRNLEPFDFQDIYDHLGLTDFLSGEGKISAKKYSVMLRALYNSSYLSDENSQKLLNFLNETPFKEYLGSGLPDSVKFSHKIGVSDDQKVFLDSGIVFVQNRPYILTAMLQTENKEYAEKVMKDISEQAYQYVVNYSGKEEQNN
ncbi:MAG: serine hydrolase [Patescibacteria group bacterium]